MFGVKLAPDTYSYDANGNMTYRIEGGVTYSQAYNAENRISSIAKRTDDCTTGIILKSWSFARACPEQREGMGMEQRNWHKR